MPVPRWFYWLFSCSLLLLLFLLGYGWLALYRSENKRVQEDVENIVRKTAEQVQNRNLTLNNIAKGITDKDYLQKTAFAIGMTQNQAKLGITFDDSEKTPLPDTVPHINKNWLDSNHVKFIPSAVKTIKYFDSVFNIQLKKDRLNIPYNIEKIRMHVLPSGQYTSPLFIINFYDPDVYRVVYGIPAILLIRRLLPYTGICLFLLVLLSGAFVLYHRSYRLQSQMAQFKESLFSNVTHELKTPLASLRLIVGSLQDDEPGLSAKQKQYIDFADKELQRMNMLIEKILSFGKLDQQQFALNKEIINLSDLINEAMQIMLITAGDKKAEIIFEPAGIFDVAGDRILLLNMLVSIIDNAIKYNSNNPVIHISLQQDNNNMQIIISDNGAGIKPQYHSKIFEPFFRVPTADDHSVKGHGLGLSFAQQVAALHSGKIIVESEQPTGSTFTIILPLL